MKQLRVAAAQINPTVGDLAGNSAKIAAAARQAKQLGAALLVTPELALTGYPPEDLLLLPDFARRVEAAMAQLLSELPEGLDCLIGLPRWTAAGCCNAAAWVRDRQIIGWYAKARLPNDSVFDEERYFVAGEQPLVVSCCGVRVAVQICEDLWHPQPLAAAAAAGCDLAVALNASPFHWGKDEERVAVVRARSQEQGCAVLYVNAVGGQDELIFDGSSFALAGDGTLAWRGPAFAETVALLTWEAGQWRETPPRQEPLPAEEAWWQALVLATRDYLDKNRFPGAVIGLSGGIDSALVAAIAVAALGPERVRTVMMPSPYTAAMSLEDAALLASRLGVRHDVIPIASAMDTFSAMLEPLFAGLPADTTEENLQARFRGVLLMALSNKSGALVLTTGNKSELATGYCTLYGDMAGGFAVIKDLYKTEVYRLARWINRQREVIPARILERPPSAELRPNQVDQERLPPYEVLDAILQRYLEGRQGVEEIVRAGFAPPLVAQVVGLLHASEYKRQQAPLGPRLSRCAFGRDWRMPITSRFRPELPVAEVSSV